MELDGALVVDLADRGSAALDAGVQIGWRVAAVDGKLVAEDVGAAASMLRKAEERPDSVVKVCFVTEEPEHWREASKRLQRGMVTQ